MLHLAMARYLLLLLILFPCLAKAQCPMPDNSPAGTLDTCFRLGERISSSVLDVDFQSDGKLIACGKFVRFGTLPQNRIARIDSGGNLDNTFHIGTGFDEFVEDVAIQPDGKILCGGQFTSYNGNHQVALVRLNTDGNLDTTFRPDFALTGAGRTAVITIAPQPDGKILVGGIFTAVNGVTRNNIARLESDGTLDLTFDPGSGFSSNPSCIVIQPDGRIVAGGSFLSFNGIARNCVARLRPNGSLDLSFDPGGGTDQGVRAVSLQADGKIVLGGVFAAFNGRPYSRLVRLNSTGSIDTTFNIGSGFSATGLSIPSVRCLSIQQDGKILAAGTFSHFNGSPAGKIVRLNWDGSRDNSFSIGWGFIGAAVSVISRSSPSKIYVGGNFNTFQGIAASGLVRFIAPTGLVATRHNLFNQHSLNPNPATSTVTLTSPEPIAEATLISANGKQVPIVLSKENTFSVAGVRPGIYTVVIRTGSGRVAHTRLAIQP